jgi:hypothetical protein
MVDWNQNFFERRRSRAGPANGHERRQFADAHEELPPAAREFARAVDAYKLAHGRKFITLAEIFDIFTGLGYRK